MENVTKIDIIVDTIYCYDEITNERVNYPLTSEYDFFMNEFSDTQELLTVNITDPIARIMKFYTIENSIPKSFTELNYSDMTEEQKIIWDSFVLMIKSK
jgi:hypothetical protein|tara:strand:- start:330 stop:626 length:297 start_codon:yes stop_codon:yes gene_type:complete